MAKNSDVVLIKKWAVSRFREMLKGAAITEQVTLFVDNNLDEYPFTVQIVLTNELRKKLEAGQLSEFSEEKL